MDKNDAFSARMFEQVCQIQAYKRKLEQQGRDITIDEAAFEWISLYAKEFPPVEVFEGRCPN